MKQVMSCILCVTVAVSCPLFSAFAQTDWPLAAEMHYQTAPRKNMAVSSAVPASSPRYGVVGVAFISNQYEYQTGVELPHLYYDELGSAPTTLPEAEPVSEDFFYDVFYNRCCVSLAYDSDGNPGIAVIQQYKEPNSRYIHLQVRYFHKGSDGTWTTPLSDPTDTNPSQYTWNTAELPGINDSTWRPCRVSLAYNGTTPIVAFSFNKDEILSNGSELETGELRVLMHMPASPPFWPEPFWYSYCSKSFFDAANPTVDSHVSVVTFDLNTQSVPTSFDLYYLVTSSQYNGLYFRTMPFWWGNAELICPSTPAAMIHHAFRAPATRNIPTRRIAYSIHRYFGTYFHDITTKMSVKSNTSAPWVQSTVTPYGGYELVGFSDDDNPRFLLANYGADPSEPLPELTPIYYYDGQQLPANPLDLSWVGYTHLKDYAPYQILLGVAANLLQTSPGCSLYNNYPGCRPTSPKKFFWKSSAECYDSICYKPNP